MYDYALPMYVTSLKELSPTKTKCSSAKSSTKAPSTPRLVYKPSKF